MADYIFLQDDGNKIQIFRNAILYIAYMKEDNRTIIGTIGKEFKILGDVVNDINEAFNGSPTTTIEKQKEEIALNKPKIVMRSQ